MVIVTRLVLSVDRAQFSSLSLSSLSSTLFALSYVGKSKEKEKQRERERESITECLSREQEDAHIVHKNSEGRMEGEEKWVKMKERNRPRHKERKKQVDRSKEKNDSQTHQANEMRKWMIQFTCDTKVTHLPFNLLVFDASSSSSSYSYPLPPPPPPSVLTTKQNANNTLPHFHMVSCKLTPLRLLKLSNSQRNRMQARHTDAATVTLSLLSSAYWWWWWWRCYWFIDSSPASPPPPPPPPHHLSLHLTCHLISQVKMMHFTRLSFLLSENLWHHFTTFILSCVTCSLSHQSRHLS